MALKTQGFSLSALPRSPSVPNNIGVLDMKAIDDGVRRALANFETIRSLPQSMALAVNTVRQEVFGATRPASTLVEVSRLAIPGARVEVEAVAYVP